MLLRHKDGALVSVHLDYNQRPASHILEIMGTKGTIQWNGLNAHTRWWSTKRDGWQDIPAPEGFERNEMFLDEMRHFLDVINGAATPVCSLADGVRALQIGLAVKRSAVEGSRWVQVGD
jgi:predicted dehydrogenase